MTVGIYWIYQVSRDRAVYVGSSDNVEKRLKTHARTLKTGKHFNPRLCYTWNKYGETDFKFAMLEACAVDRLIEREQFWMDALAPVCNVSEVAGSPVRGTCMSDDVKMKIAASHRGRKHGPMSAEQKQILRDINTGKKYPPMSEEHKMKHRIASTGKVVSEETRRKIREIRTGSHHGEQAKKKLSEYWSGRKRGPYTEERKKRMSEARIGKKLMPWTEERRQKVKETWRRKKESQ